MKNRILIAGCVCLSVFAAAQSSDKQQKASTTKVASPRDIATGQASGRKMNQKAESDGIIHRDIAARESSAPSVSEIRESPSKGSTALRESPSKASLGKTSVRESSSPSETEVQQSPTPSNRLRESPSLPSQTKPPAQVRVAAGDVNGDGKADLTWSPRSNKAQVAAGDVDGDGTLDATVNKNSGHATEQSAINSSHSNIKNAREAATGQASGKRQQPDTKK